MPTLRPVSGGPEIRVDSPLVLIGRHPQCDARLDSDWVSLRHCVLTEDAGDVVVRDLVSTNGTWVNGRRVELGRLKPGDEKSIAHIRYRLEGAAEYDATVPLFAERPEACPRQKGMGNGAGSPEKPGNPGPVA
jgi:pSer/pThr/pTyr-binding forkhead associated (FHA) protein